MASVGSWLAAEVEHGILLSVTEENGVVTRTYVAPLLDKPQEVEDKDPLALPIEFPMPFYCPHCGNGIGSSGAFTMHVRACQRRMAAADQTKKLPEQPQAASSSGHVERSSQDSPRKPLEPKSPDPDCRPLTKSTFGRFGCIFCNKRFTVQFRPDGVRRRFACDECGKRVRAREKERKKNSTAQRKLLSCDRCGKQYKLEGFLIRHKMVCQGFSVKRKREYEIHEIVKKKTEDKSCQDTEKKKRKKESSEGNKENKSEKKTCEGNKKKKPEEKSCEATEKKKPEEERCEVIEIKIENDDTEGQIYEVTEIELECEIYELTEFDGELVDVTEIKFEN